MYDGNKINYCGKFRGIGNRRRRAQISLVVSVKKPSEIQLEFFSFLFCLQRKKGHPVLVALTCPVSPWAHIWHRTLWPHPCRAADHLPRLWPLDPVKFWRLPQTAQLLQGGASFLLYFTLSPFLFHTRSECCVVAAAARVVIIVVLLLFLLLLLLKCNPKSAVMCGWKKMMMMMMSVDFNRVYAYSLALCRFFRVRSLSFLLAHSFVLSYSVLLFL